MNDMYCDPIMTIGTFAEKIGLSVSAIRKYENEGLLISHRSSTGRRLFSREDLDRVRIIQHLINGLGINIEGIRRLQALLPCWEMLPCSRQDRENCIAYRDTSKPCWMHKIAENPGRSDVCRSCPVYRLGSQCIEDIKRVVYRVDNIDTMPKGNRQEE